jgi:7-cyano-7-deazaguanine synthase
MKESKVLVLVSGGLDSATCLYWAKKNFSQIYAITFDYYGRIENEKKAAIALSEKASTLELFRISIPFIKESSDFYSGKHVSPTTDKRWASYIPARNLIFYSIAAHYAEFLDIKWVIGGHSKDDGLFFKDATESFIKDMNSLFNRGCQYCNERPYTILAPLASLDRVEIIRLAIKLEVPLDLTWSCHRSGETQCGQCYACTSRSEAFRFLGIADPAFSSGDDNKPP